MAKERSTRPYLIRALYEWCTDSGYTPYLTVKVDARTRVPLEYVKDGEIVLNVSAAATHRLTLGNDLIQFAARFNGASWECSIPVDAVIGIFARENGQGLVFPAAGPADAAPDVPAGDADAPEPPPAAPPGRPKLQVIK